VFRWRLSIETLKWLAYAVVRKRPEIIKTSTESETPYDLPGLDAIRRLLRSRLPGAGSAA
jgi:hypothetical protein